MRSPFNYLLAVLFLILVGAAPKPTPPTPTPSASPKAVATPTAVKSSQPTPVPDPLTQPCTGNTSIDGRSDLCAQWTAARAAGNAATWTMWSTIFSAASILGVIAALALSIRSNKLARETAERELRAYVSVQPVTLALYQGDKVLEVAITMRNGGSTPAYECVHAGNIVILDKEKAKVEFGYKDERVQHGERVPLTLHSGQEISGAITSPTKFTDRQIADVHQGKQAIYAFGFAEYKDTFGKTRYSRFCYSVSGKSFGVDKGMTPKDGVPIPMIWHLEPFHNDAT